MKLRDIITILLCLVIACGLFFTGSTQLKKINQQRKDMKLVINEPLENAPPSLAFATVAMGSFRGIVVDFLWMRADNLKEQGMFFDAKQLAEWITVLQPRLTAVWDFQAWNMAYNISVTFPNTQPAERWKWVYSGIELLRDRGIPINPKKIILYRQLAWIFQHKMGGVTDDCHKYYRVQLAKAMQPLIGPNTDEHFEKLKAAPKTLEELIADPQVKTLVEAMQKADPELVEVKKLVRAYLTFLGNTEGFSEDFRNMMFTFKDSPAVAGLQYFSQAWELRNTWKMDIDLMIWVNKEYGPVDVTKAESKEHMPINWLHPQAHAIYWAELGLREAPDKNDISIERLNTDRIVNHSLQSLYKTGNMVLYTVQEPVPVDPTDPEPEEFRLKLTDTVYLMPDLRMFDSYKKSALKRIAFFEDQRQSEGQLRSQHTGFKNMLEGAVSSFYDAGYKAKALAVYKDLVTRYKQRDTQRYSLSLDAFCKLRFKEELEGLSITKATEIIQLNLRQAYFLFAHGKDNEAATREKLITAIYNRYMAEFGDEAQRLGLPTLEKMKYQAIKSFLKDPYFPDYTKGLLLNRIKNEKPDLYQTLVKQLELDPEAQKQKENSQQ